MSLCPQRVHEILKAARDKMEANCMRLRMFFVVFSIAFPVVLMVTLMYQNSSFGLFEGFSKGNVLGGGAKNVTAELLTGGPNITTNGSELEGRDENDNRVRRSKNSSLTSSTSDSTPHSGISDEKDKLFDGLLASGFDEASCISKLQSHLYRKASTHKPSPYLISKLRSYEELHRRCGPNSRSYNKDMTKIEHSKNKGVATMCKYIIWTPANGLGNQMISMASTFLYAVLTDRVLLGKFGKDNQGLFCEPFLNSTWLLPEKSPFWNETHVKTYQNLIEKDRANSLKEDLPSVLFLDLRYSPHNLERFFHCDHSQDLLQKVPLLILQSGQYFVPSLFMTPFFNKEINNMFPEINTIFHHLGRYLFHPSNDAWGLISKFYQAHLAKADERIGLQIRVFNLGTTSEQEVMEIVLSCTMQHKLLPELGIKNSVSFTNKNQTVKAVLVVSLYKQFGENLRTMYMKKPTVTGEVIEIYQPSHEEHQKFNDNKHNMKAWVEMYLLSLSDVLVTSSQSTFGYVAQGLGNLRPWVLYKPGIGNKESHFAGCEREFSFDPCFHYPPRHYCNGKPLKDYASSFRHIRKCWDYPIGVKLINGSIISL